MNEVEQTTFGYPNGNCFAACVASIFEIGLVDTPNVAGLDGPKWWDVWHAWARSRGLGIITFDHSKIWQPAGYSILSAVSPRVKKPDGSDVLHSVVARFGKIVWDPHPERAMGVGKWRDWVVFHLLDPKRFA